MTRHLSFVACLVVGLACERAPLEPAEATVGNDVPLVQGDSFAILDGEPTIRLTHWYATVNGRAVEFDRSPSQSLHPDAIAWKPLVNALRETSRKEVSIAAEPSIPYHSLFRVILSARLAGANAMTVARVGDLRVKIPLVIPVGAPDVSYDDHALVEITRDAVRLSPLPPVPTDEAGFAQLRAKLRSGHPDTAKIAQVRAFTIWPSRYVTVRQLVGVVAVLAEWRRDAVMYLTLGQE